MPNENVRLRVREGDREFEAEGPQKFVEDALSRFEGKSPTSSTGKATAKSAHNEATSSTKSLSLSEFIRRVGVTKHTDLVLAFGYYLEKYRGMTDFTPADINSCYYETKREASNTSQAIIQNMKTARLMAAKGDGAGRAKYVVTATGEEAIQSWLSAKTD